MSDDKTLSEKELQLNHRNAVREYLASKEALKTTIRDSKLRFDGFLGSAPISLSSEKAREIANAAIAAYEAELVYSHYNRLKLLEQTTKNLDESGFKF